MMACFAALSAAHIRVKQKLLIAAKEKTRENTSWWPKLTTQEKRDLEQRQKPPEHMSSEDGQCSCRGTCKKCCCILIMKCHQGISMRCASERGFCWCSFFSSFLSYFFVFQPCCAHLVHQYRSLLNCVGWIQVLYFAFSVCSLFVARSSLIPPPSWFTVFFQKSPSSQSSSLFKLWQMSNKHAFGSFDA